MDQGMNRLAHQIRQTLGVAQDELDQVQAELDRIAAEHRLLIRTRDVCQEWLYAHGYGGEPDQDKQDQPHIPFAAAIRQVLTEARGEALHRRTIVDRAMALGARSEARDIFPVVATACRRMKAQKMGNGYWRLPVDEAEAQGSSPAHW